MPIELYTHALWSAFIVGGIGVGLLVLGLLVVILLIRVLFYESSHRDR